MNKQAAFLDQFIKIGGLADIAKYIGGGIRNAASESAGYMRNFAKDPIGVGKANMHAILFDGLKPNASFMEKAMFNPIVQGYFTGYLPAKALYNIYNSDTNHKGEAYGGWIGSQAGMLAVPMTAGFVPAIGTNIALAMAGSKAGEMLDRLMAKKKPKEPAERTEQRIVAQLPQSQLTTY